MRPPVVRTIQFIIDRTLENESGCWIWQKSISSSSGYGDTHYQVSCGVQKRISAHRLSFYLWNGYLPVVVRHICNNRKCCNPLHLLDGDHSDNLVDRYLQRITDRLTTLHGWTYAEVAQLISD